SVGVLGDPRRGIAGVVDENFLRGDGDVDRVLEGFDIEFAIGAEIFHQVQRGQVAGRIVQKHVLGARVRGVDPRGALAGVPAIDGGVVLHAGIAAMPGGVGNFLQQVAGAEFFAGLAVGDVAGPPVAILFGGAHEVVGDAHGVIGVLEEDGAVGVAVDAGIVALLDEDVGLALFLHLAFDEFDDVRVIDVEYHHLGGATGLTTALDYADEGVEALHKTDRAGSDATTREGFLAAAQ